MEIIARRLFSPIYIYFDIAFLVLFLGLLIYKKKYMTMDFSNWNSSTIIMGISFINRQYSFGWNGF